MQINRVTLAGKVKLGPHWRERPKTEIHCSEFMLEQFVMHRQHHRCTRIWCRAFGAPAYNVQQYVQRRDWVLVEGELITRKWALPGSRRVFHSDGTPVRYMQKIEIMAYQIDLLERPWHDDYMKVRKDEYARFAALRDKQSRWEVPKDKLGKLLTPDQVHECLTEVHEATEQELLEEGG